MPCVDKTSFSFILAESMLKVGKCSQSFNVHVGNELKNREMDEFGLDGEVLNGCKCIWCLSGDAPNECSAVSAISGALTSLPGGDVANILSLF